MLVLAHTHSRDHMHMRSYVRVRARKAPFKRKNGIRSAKIAFHKPVIAFE